MKVLDVIKLVCDFVGEKELRAKLEADETLSAREQEKVALLQRCFNLVNQEIATDYLPFLTKEQVSGSVIQFSSLSKNVVHVMEIKNRFGMNLKFKLFPNYVEVEGNAKSITYSFFPDECNLQDEVEKFCGLSQRIYAYGVASEYLLIDGVSSDAEIWENRYKESLFMLSQKRGEHTLPKRRWL